jgi:NAD+ synthase
MTDRLRIAFAQMNQRVGDLEGNAAAMIEMRRRAAGADLLLCPELQLTGYPPEDLVLKPEFVRRTMETAEKLVDWSTNTSSPRTFSRISTKISSSAKRRTEALVSGISR